MFDANKYRQDFNILANPDAKQVYFDSACMSLKPKQVIDAMVEYYHDYPACVGRSSHHLSQLATKKVHAVRAKVAKFINAREAEIIFTRNTTESINLVARGLGLKPGDIILTSDKEHNSNLVPWQLLAEETGAIHKILPSHEDNTFDLANFRSAVVGAKIVAIGYTANLDGVSAPIKEIVEIAHQAGALVLVDSAQAMLHQKVDVAGLGVDYLAFSGHKMLGPTGTGVLYGKSELLNKLKPFIVGGDTVETVTYTEHKFLPVPEKFEAGLQDYAGILGLGAAIDYLEALDFDAIKAHELELNTQLSDIILAHPKVTLIGPRDPSLRSGIISFYIPGFDSHQFALTMDQMSGVMLRSGQHCVHSWFNAHDVATSIRVSLAFYNNQADVDNFKTAFNKIIQII